LIVLTNERLTVFLELEQPGDSRLPQNLFDTRARFSQNLAPLKADLNHSQVENFFPARFFASSRIRNQQKQKQPAGREKRTI
jgi:hypothetical protein